MSFLSHHSQTVSGQGSVIKIVFFLHLYMRVTVSSGGLHL
jgi:hypothetical protein